MECLADSQDNQSLPHSISHYFLVVPKNKQPANDFTSSIFNHANVPSGQINLTQLKLSKKRYNIINRFFWKVTTVWRDCVEQEERDQRQEEGATAPSNHEAVKPQIRQSEHGERAQISGVIWE